MGNRKPLCTILWVTQILFVLLAVSFMSLWVMNELGLFGTDGIWFLSPERSGAFEPIISILTFVFVGGNYFVLQTFCGGSDKSEPSLGRPKKLTNHTYRQYIRYRFRNFNVKGLSTHGPYTLELARVYVELSVAPKPFHAASSNIVQLPEKLQSGRHDIWAYLQQTEQDFAIIGPPGSGKTTLLSHIALTLTQSWFQRRKESVPNKLPILLTLLEHAEAIATEGLEPFAMEDAVRADLRKWKKEVPEGWVRRFLDKGKYLILLDGLDEVADKVQRQKVVAWVERQIKAYPMCQFIVTSRPHGYQSNPIAGVTTLEIRPYDNRQQAQFIRNWYLANEVMSHGGKEDAGVQMAAKEGADDLLRRLGDSPNLSELAVNPLLLTMIATVHRFRSALPKRRVELYDEIFSVFLGTWRGARGIEQELTPDQRKQVLQPLAWAMMEQQMRQISTDEAIKIIREPLRRVDRKMTPDYFLEIVRYQSGLLVEKENRFLAFAHLTFQEYLAAMYIQSHENLFKLLLDQVQNTWLHEMLLLYAAKRDATPIIEACINANPTMSPDALVLAIECEKEAIQVAPEIRKRLEEVMARAVIGDDAEIGFVVGEAWLQGRLKHLFRFSENVHVDSSLITHAEYQLFLNRHQYRQPDHWLQQRYPKETGDRPVVGVRREDATAYCRWLTQRSNGIFSFRLPNHNESKINDKNFLGYSYWLSEEGEGSFKASVETRISKEKILSYQALDLDFAVDRAQKRLLDFGVNIDLANALTEARSYSPNFNFEHCGSIDLDFTLSLIRDSSLDLDRAMKLVANTDPKVHIDFRQAISLARSLSRAFERHRFYDLDRVRKNSPDLSRFFELTLSLSNGRREFRGILISIGYLIRQIYQQRGHEISIIQKGLNESSNDQSFLSKLEDDFLLSFVELCILEERIKGNLSAFEGIRIVRERVREG